MHETIELRKEPYIATGAICLLGELSCCEVLWALARFSKSLAYTLSVQLQTVRTVNEGVFSVFSMPEEWACP